MSKIIIVPDIHGRTHWPKLLDEATPFDHCVFLGDYVDSFDTSLTPIKQADNLAHIIEIKRADPEKVTLLVGNHDLQYFDPTNSRFRCSGFNSTGAYIYADLFRDNWDLFQLADFQDEKLITHAGVTDWWLGVWVTATQVDPKSKGDIVDIFVDPVNEYLQERHSKALNIISAVGHKRGGNNRTGGPLWADRVELCNFSVQGIDQVVGHTQVERLEIFNTDFGDKLYFCDNGLESVTVIEEVTFEEEYIESFPHKSE